MGPPVCQREQLHRLVLQGKINSRETMVEGFGRLPCALIDMLGGANIGKMVVRCHGARARM